ncbi:MAG: hypothetical protein LBB98_10830 [Treponema sp.]|nr:hypothetical protein [Treponema sp.]
MCRDWGARNSSSNPLKESVPALNPADRETWAKRIGLSTLEVKEYNRLGCKFAERCPMTKDICRGSDPPGVEIDDRTVKCYLYGGKKGSVS